MSDSILHFGKAVGESAGQRFFLSTGPLAALLPGGFPSACTKEPLNLKAGHLLRGEREDPDIRARSEVRARPREERVDLPLVRIGVHDVDEAERDGEHQRELRRVEQREAASKTHVGSRST